ncbi:hypothetical protein [Amycolatopsis sp. WGS_07]|uniref:hypothetical protein n=1 Tax=Amycolatopsis sp. WGS_07 TaxID=3076764 RepID=UPI0038739F0A
MHDLDWNRKALVGQIRDRIWSYVSPASRFEVPGLLTAAALLGWPEHQVKRLGELHFLLCREVQDFMTSLPLLARRLTTSSAQNEQISHERLHGPVRWDRTLTGRAASGSQHSYVTAPAERVYQTPENELLVHVLDGVVNAAKLRDWATSKSREEPAKLVRKHLNDAQHWQQNRMLRDIDRVAPSPRSLARIRAGRTSERYTPVLRAYEKLVSFVETPEREAIQAAIEGAGLVTALDSILFELATTFRVIDALNSHGWNVQPLYLFKGRVHTDGQQPDGRKIDVWYQSLPPDVHSPSKYKEILTKHGFSQQPDLRPDLWLRWTDRGGRTRWLLVECKLSQSKGVQTAARHALSELIGYREAFRTTLATSEPPYGLGVAWGAGLEPQLDSDVALCTPDMLDKAMAVTTG